MSKLRLPSCSRRGGRLLAVGVAAALIAVPGVAAADTGPGPVPALPTGSAPGPVGGLVGQLPVPTPGDGVPTLPALPTPPQQAGPQAATPGSTTADSSPPLPGAPSMPPQLQQLLDSLQPSPECSKAIQADLTKLLTDIPNLVQAIITELTQQLAAAPRRHRSRS